MTNPWIPTVAFFGTTAVVLGAFGAHALADRLTPGELSSWRTAVQYHLLHSVALLALALAYERGERRVAGSARCFAIGIPLFSGSIYCLVLTDWRWLGPVTPIGGVFLIAGWAALLRLARAPIRERTRKSS